MNDMISRSELLKRFPPNMDNPLWHFTGIRAAIEAAPAVDAEHVVRCNLCKYYEQDTGFCQYWGGGNHWNGFCNNGARMDAEGDR